MGSRAQRLLAGALALSLAALSAASYLSWRRERERLLEMLDELGTGVREPGVVSDLRREPDELNARLRAARALLADELDRSWMNELDDVERERARALSQRKLDSALAISREILRSQPASWQARMILAGATYLEMSRRRDPRRWTERARWEEPLRDAMAMATSQVEPRRILAAAYLNDWSLMTSQERAAGRRVLRVAFRDRATLEQLLETWLRRAETLDQALDLIPADVMSWELVEEHFRNRGDWERACEAHERKLEILPDSLDATLRRAEKRLAGGQPREARYFALQALAATPVGPAYVATLERVLRALPPGPIHPRHQQWTKSWLTWARRECLLRDCLLPTEVVRRLRALSQHETSADRAWVAELAGDTYSAEAHEQDAFVPNAPEWTAYLLLKAKRLAGTGQPGAAAALLAQLPREAAERATTKAVEWLVASRLALASGRAPSAWESPPVAGPLGATVKEYFWEEPPERLRLRFAGVGPAGAAVELLWSDRFEECREVNSGSVVTLAAPPVAGFQILETRPLRGGRAHLLDARVVP